MERKETPRNFCEEVYGKSTNVDIGKWKSINIYILLWYKKCVHVQSTFPMDLDITQSLSPGSDSFIYIQIHLVHTFTKLLKFLRQNEKHIGILETVSLFCDMETGSDRIILYAACKVRNCCLGVSLKGILYLYYVPTYLLTY